MGWGWLKNGSKFSTRNRKTCGCPAYGSIAAQNSSFFLVVRDGKELNLLEIDMTQLVVSAASVSVDFLLGKQATCPTLS